MPSKINHKNIRDFSHKQDLKYEKQIFLQQYVYKKSPFENANFFQKIFFTWVNPI